MSGLITMFLLLLNFHLALGNNKIFEKLESMNQMRNALAATLDQYKIEITELAFQKVCMPVGKELQSWGQLSGFQVRQISHKNRNPQNTLKPHDTRAYEKFQNDEKLIHLKVQTSEKDLTGPHYYYRISVTSSCLHCHGEKENRPPFIKAKYPNDKAFDFKPGELRGLYSVSPSTLK